MSNKEKYIKQIKEGNIKEEFKDFLEEIIIEDEDEINYLKEEYLDYEEYKNAPAEVIILKLVSTLSNEEITEYLIDKIYDMEEEEIEKYIKPEEENIEKITREDYLHNSKELHRDYYAQFVDDDILEYVKKSKLKLGDKLNKFDFAASSVQKSNQLKELGDTDTLSGRICILKEACRQIEEKEKLTLILEVGERKEEISGTMDEICETLYIDKPNEIFLKDFIGFLNDNLKEGKIKEQKKEKTIKKQKQQNI
jgi:hypothetical protein